MARLVFQTIMASAVLASAACAGNGGGPILGPPPFDEVPEVPVLRQADVDDALSLIAATGPGEHVLQRDGWRVWRSLAATGAGTERGVYLEIGLSAPTSSPGPWTQLGCDRPLAYPAELTGIAALVDVDRQQIRLLVPLVMKGDEPRYLVPAVAEVPC